MAQLTSPVCRSRGHQWREAVDEVVTDCQLGAVAGQASDDVLAADSLSAELSEMEVAEAARQVSEVAAVAQCVVVSAGLTVGLSVPVCLSCFRVSYTHV